MEKMIGGIYSGPSVFIDRANPQYIIDKSGRNDKSSMRTTGRSRSRCPGGLPKHLSAVVFVLV